MHKTEPIYFFLMSALSSSWTTNPPAFFLISEMPRLRRVGAFQEEKEKPMTKHCWYRIIQGLVLLFDYIIPDLRRKWNEQNLPIHARN